jgi:CelD/BcsL family acetyltransferase involved in cellulose biosynthesis
MTILTFDQFKALHASGHLTCYYPAAVPDALLIWLKNFGPKVRLFFLKAGGCYVPFVEKTIFGKRMLFLFCGRELWFLPIYKEAEYVEKALRQDLQNAFNDFFSNTIFVKVTAAPEWFSHVFHGLSRELHYKTIERASKTARVILCDTSFTEYVKSIANKKHIREVGRLKRKIQKKYSLGFRVFTGDEAARGLEKAYAISRKSWKDRHGTAIGGKGKDGRYYRSIFDYFLNQKSLYVFVITVNEDAAGFLIGCRHKDVLFCVKTGFDEYFKEYGLGSIVFYEAIQWCFNEKSILKIDFLTDYPYLRYWSSLTCEYHSFYLFNTTILSRCAYYLSIAGLACKHRIKNILSSSASRTSNACSKF